jgi:hypothetical protein
MSFFKRTFHTSFLQSLFPIGQLVSEEKIEMWKVYKRQWMLSDGNISHDCVRRAKKLDLHCFDDTKSDLKEFVIRFLNYFKQIASFLCVIWFPPSIKLKTTI